VQLTAADALAAHAEAEHGLTISDAPTRPVLTALSAGLAFGVGSAFPMLSMLLSPSSWRSQTTFVAVVLALCATSAITARTGGANPKRTIARTVVIGVLTMTLTSIGGSFIEL
jgi:VIT1/CCC1 family predicted Fe2+/Mn2+ transporter